MGGRGAASGAANGMALGRKMSVSKFLENLKKTYSAPLPLILP